MKSLLGMLMMGLVALTMPVHGAERLVYAVVHKSSDHSPMKTDVFSIDPESAEKRVVFSDESTSILLLQRLYVFHFPVVGGGKLFAHAAERGVQVGFPGNASIYELSTDGSNSFRMVAEVIGGESLGEIFADPTGTLVGYVNRLKRKQYIFIHDVKTGDLKHRIDATDIFLDCFPSAIGWLGGGDRLFFSLEAGDVHITSEESYDRVGSYVMDLNGEGPTRLDPVPALEGVLPPQTVRLVGVLPAGDYLYETMQQRRRPAPGRYRMVFEIIKASPDSARFKRIGFSAESGLYSGIRVCYRLSPSGRYLAAAALPVSSSAVSGDIWLKDLYAGTERKLVSIPAKGLDGPFIGLVGWVD